jgi:hypothetical protein
VLPDLPAPLDLPDDPASVLRAQNEEDGLQIDEQTSTPDWHGEPLDVGYAIAVLHPLAR